MSRHPAIAGWPTSWTAQRVLAVLLANVRAEWLAAHGHVDIALQLNDHDAGVTILHTWPGVVHTITVNCTITP